MAITRMARRLRQESGTGGEISPTLAAALATIEREGPLTPSALADARAHPAPDRDARGGAAGGAGARDAHAGPGRRAASPTSRSRRAGATLLKRIRTRKNEYLARRLRELTPAEQATLAEAAAILERLLARSRGRAAQR